MRTTFLSLLLLAGILQTPPLAAQKDSEKKKVFTFTNNTGQDANDLHMELSNGTIPTNIVEDGDKIKRAGGVFANYPVEGSPTTHDYKEGTVADDGSITLQFKDETKVRKWWWTKDGKRIGDIQSGSTVSVEPGGANNALVRTAGISGRVSVKEDNGLQTIAIQTDAGKLNICLPSAIHTGARISGKVTTEPVGKNEKQQAQNKARLEGMVIEMKGDPKKGAGEDILRFTAAAVPGVLAAVLRDRGGNILETLEIPVKSAPPNVLPAGGFDIPALGQTGRPFVIGGPTDGDLSTTNVSIGGQAGEILAEASDLGSIVCSKPGQTGIQNVSITEGNAMASGAIRLIDIALTADKTNLKPNESTALELTVSGLQGLDQPVHVDLANNNPAIIALTGGNTRRIIVQPGMEAADGTWFFHETATGVMPGYFDVQAQVDLPVYNRPGEASPALLKAAACKCDEVKAEVTLINLSKEKYWIEKQKQLQDWISGAEATLKNPNSTAVQKAAAEKAVVGWKKDLELIEKRLKDKDFEEKLSVAGDVVSRVAENGDVVRLQIQIRDVDAGVCDCKTKKDCAFLLDSKQLQGQYVADQKNVVKKFSEHKDKTTYVVDLEIPANTNLAEAPYFLLNIPGRCTKPGCADSEDKTFEYQITFDLK